VVEAVIGKNVILVNDEELKMDVAPIIVEGRTLVPARFIAEAFDCIVEWDEATRTVNIKSKLTIVSGLDFYEGLELPTYTYITGQKAVYMQDEDLRMSYVYKYDKDEFMLYLNTLVEQYGFEVFDYIDNTASDGSLGVYLYKDGEFYILYVNVSMGYVIVSYLK